MQEEEYKGYTIKTKIICKSTNDEVYEIWKDGKLVRAMIGSLDMTKVIIDEIINRQEV